MTIVVVTPEMSIIKYTVVPFVGIGYNVGCSLGCHVGGSLY